MKRFLKYIIPSAAILLSAGMSSCTGDLDVTPISPKLVTEANIDGLFNKCYANLALAGNGDGGSGDGECDIAGYKDNGMTGLIRQMWNSNELTTDEAICSWGDDGIPQFNFNTYDAAEPMAKAYFSRLTVGISFCNQYLAIAADHNAKMTAEIRFVRALEYYLLMDAFGNVPFTEVVAKPVQYTRAQMYEWLEKELLAIEPDLSDAKAKTSADAQYGHADKACVWMLLSRLYLNAEVYTGTAQWAKAAEYAKKVMDAGYQLNTTGQNGWSAYQMLFMGDNGESSAARECIFPIYQDSKTTASYGSSTFLVASCFSDNMHANLKDPTGYNGTTEHWDGNRARPDLVKKFFPMGNAPQVPSYEMVKEAGDDRAIFYGEDHTLEIDKYTEFKQGYGVAKFIAYKSDGSATFNTGFSDGDFFFFRLAEAYLTYAEATARLNGNKTTKEGTDAVNALRARAHTSTRTNNSYSLNDLLDEWSREFYFEGIRRPILIRFGKYGGNTDYIWSWKGGTKQGRNFEAYKNVFAIPTDELTSNSNLKQNTGY